MPCTSHRCAASGKGAPPLPHGSQFPVSDILCQQASSLSSSSSSSNTVSRTLPRQTDNETPTRRAHGTHGAEPTPDGSKPTFECSKPTFECSKPTFEWGETNLTGLEEAHLPNAHSCRASYLSALAAPQDRYKEPVAMAICHALLNEGISFTIGSCTCVPYIYLYIYIIRYLRIVYYRILGKGKRIGGLHQKAKK